MRPSKPQPFIRIQAEVNQEDYTHFGFPLKPPHKKTFINALADTGCQSCLAGSSTVRKLGLSTRDLIPVQLRMHAANNNMINILGAAIIRFLSKNTKGETKTTRQIIYITDSTEKLFLSREACADLGIISDKFPIPNCNAIKDKEGLPTTDVVATAGTDSSRRASQQGGPNHFPCQPLSPTRPPTPTGKGFKHICWTGTAPVPSTLASTSHSP